MDNKEVVNWFEDVFTVGDVDVLVMLEEFWTEIDVMLVESTGEAATVDIAFVVIVMFLLGGKLGTCVNLLVEKNEDVVGNIIEFEVFTVLV